MALTLPQLNEKFIAKQKETFDFYKSFETDKGLTMTPESIEKGVGMRKELEALSSELKSLRDTDAYYQSLKESREENSKEDIARHGFNDKNEGRKSLGEMVVNSNEFKSGYRSGSTDRGRLELKGIDLQNFLKTTMSTSAGFANANNRTSDVVGYALETPRLANIIPTISTNVDIVKYMEKTTRTNNAASQTQGSALGENAYAWTERSSTVETIGAFLPVTEQQLQVPELMQSVINDDLALDLALKEESYLLTGDGSTPNIRGFYNVSGIQTYAKGTGGATESTPDAAYQLLNLIRNTGFANPTAFVMHPNDWVTIRLLRDTTGAYIWGSPAMSGMETLWGLPVIQTTNATENTVLSGDFAGYARIYRKQNALVEWGYNSDDFSKYKQTVRITESLTLVTRRAGAFGTLTSV